MKTPKLRIYFDNLQDRLPAGYKLMRLVRRAAEAVLQSEAVRCDAEVSVTFADDAQMRVLNKKYRAVDKATDVLSFPLEDGPVTSDEPLVLGDIVISLERARRQAEEYGHSYEREVAFLCAHAMLHLLGYDHERGEEADLDMRRRQRRILESIGLGEHPGA
ncbi:MAG TPA: rRNA maturation RNase YbeY [Clostridiales bacterium]|jgi:probable rRNA maturation factor|nr:rRNA maturation RNase YbeY [Clostridiales bacterium]